MRFFVNAIINYDHLNKMVGLFPVKLEQYFQPYIAHKYMIQKLRK